MKIRLLVLLAVVLLFATGAFAQNAKLADSTPVQAQVAGPYLTPISSTTAVNNQTTLTIPAPPAGLYNYVCKVVFTISQDGTSTANTNAVTTSTNFNSWAIKYSLAATANLAVKLDYDMGNPATGCAKSTLPATATTFVSPAAAANSAYTWSAMYFQAQ